MTAGITTAFTTIIIRTLTVRITNRFIPTRTYIHRTVTTIMRRIIRVITIMRRVIRIMRRTVIITTPHLQDRIITTTRPLISRIMSPVIITKTVIITMTTAGAVMTTGDTAGHIIQRLSMATQTEMLQEVAAPHQEAAVLRQKAAILRQEAAVLQKAAAILKTGRATSLNSEAVTTSKDLRPELPPDTDKKSLSKKVASRLHSKGPF
jgi:hypothetical protein